MTKTELIDAVMAEVEKMQKALCVDNPEWHCLATTCEKCFLERLRLRLEEITKEEKPNATPWTPIDEDLPENYQLVLLTVEPTEENEGAQPFTMIDRYVRGDYETGWNAFFDMDEKLWRVAAWMPLPAPYERREEWQ